jgi:hypothetical protein
VDPVELLLIPLGLIVGLFGTLVGADGGFILLPVLLLAFPDTPPEQLTSISLAVAVANSLSGSAAYTCRRRIDFRSALVFHIATLPSAPPTA